MSLTDEERGTGALCCARPRLAAPDPVAPEKQPASALDGLQIALALEELTCALPVEKLILLLVSPSPAQTARRHDEVAGDVTTAVGAGLNVFHRVSQGFPRFPTVAIRR